MRDVAQTISAARVVIRRETIAVDRRSTRSLSPIHIWTIDRHSHGLTRLL